jgi:hypothetical protein
MVFYGERQLGALQHDLQLQTRVVTTLCSSNAVVKEALVTACSWLCCELVGKEIELVRQWIEVLLSELAVVLATYWLPHNTDAGC